MKEVNVTTFDKRNEKNGRSANKEMNNDTYALRRRVIDVIYEAKKHVELPRIEVRITSPDKEAAAWAYRSENIIYVTDRTINRNDGLLKHVVLHEIVHAVTGFVHDDKCILMASTYPKTVHSNEVLWRVFKSYFK